VTLPPSLQHDAGAAHHVLAAAPRLRHALSAGSRVEGPPSRTAGICRHPQPRAARHADAAGQDLSSLLPPRAGEQPGFPRFQGRNRFHSFTCKEYGNGAPLDNGYLVVSKIGRVALHWSRPIEGTIKTVTVSREADGWYACFSCAKAPTEPLPLTGRETGIDVGLKLFLITADRQIVENPRHYRKAERALKKAQMRVSRKKKGSQRRRAALRERWTQTKYAACSVRAFTYDGW
jgi:hypothetical protein